MEPYLHMRTTFLVNSVHGFTMFLCMLYVARARKTYPGFYYWTASTLLFCTGNILISLRGMMPDFISIIVSNMVLFATFLVIPYGLSLFAGKKQPAWPYLAALLVVFGALSFYTYVQPEVRTRIVILSAALSFATFYSVVHFKKNVSPLLMGSNLLVVVSLSIGGLFTLARTVYTAIFEIPVASLFSASSLQVLSIIFTTGLYTFVCFGLCILNFQRVERDLVNAIDEVKTLTGILPICAACKKIRDDQGYWRQVEAYIEQHSAATFSHSICPECADRLYPEFVNKRKGTPKK